VSGCVSAATQPSLLEAAAAPPATGVPVLHAVTADAIVMAPDFASKARAVMAAGRGHVAVHLRVHHVPVRSLFILAELLGEYQRSTGAWLVVNDRLDVALAARARGVQLTTRSVAVADAARVSGGRVALGASVHDPPAAREAAAAGARWVVAGHVHATPSHPDEPGRGLDFLRDVAGAAGPCPVIAIGGMTPDRVAEARGAGAHGIAAIRGIWDADDPAAACAAFLQRFGVATVGEPSEGPTG
jgi:thiamine-phosphate diphosphorylase